MNAATLHVWRHPRAAGAEGRCIGRTDLPVDRRKAKRLARRIQRFARRHWLPKIVVTSPMRRSRAVGRWLARWGWVHRVDAALSEMDFGAWDGRPWSAVSRSEFDRWCADFESQRPGGNGESVAQLLDRVRRWRAGGACVAVSHGGWMSGALWLTQEPSVTPTPARWPAPPKHGRMIALDAAPSDCVTRDCAPAPSCLQSA